MAAAHLDGNTPKDQRRAMLTDYKTGKLRVLSNFGVLTEGFDAPETAAILMARPTRSQTLFTQIVGRGLRPYPGKSDCLLIDLAVTDVRALEVGTLLGKMTMCKNCGIEHFAGLKACPHCGHPSVEGTFTRWCQCSKRKLASGTNCWRTMKRCSKSFAAVQRRRRLL